MKSRMTMPPDLSLDREQPVAFGLNDNVTGGCSRQ